ncbi:MAG: TraR/DksA family transcriptional regulator [Gemmatimonadales bacterium]
MSLTDHQRKHLERRLEEERVHALRALNRNVDESADETEEERSGDISSMPTHQADLGTDTMQGELEASNSTRISRELAEIDAALDRLIRTPERFGRCEDTGKDIPYARLEVIPWARTCGDAGL